MKALVVVDPQNDFITGSMAVKDAAEIIPVANKLILSGKFGLVVLTQDWHPSDHGSFASNNGGSDLVFTQGKLSGRPQTLWPDHCVWNSEGAEFHADLMAERAQAIVRKGMNPKVDSYSGFYDNDGTTVGLGGYLRGHNIAQVYIMGLATDYCVKFTALDSCKTDGFQTYLILDGCKAVNIRPNDGTLAAEEMEKAGVNLTDSNKLTS